MLSGAIDRALASFPGKEENRMLLLTRREGENIMIGGGYVSRLKPRTPSKPRAETLKTKLPMESLALLLLISAGGARWSLGLNDQPYQEHKMALMSVEQLLNQAEDEYMSIDQLAFFKDRLEVKAAGLRNRLLSCQASCEIERHSDEADFASDE